LKPDRIKPEFSNFIITLYMNMERFLAIACIKEKPIRPNFKHCRHLFS